MNPEEALKIISNARENHTKADLSRADLSEADLRGADLSCANLSYANLNRADLRYANLSKADLSEADLSRADLSRANLSYANLSKADLRRAYLICANLSSANLSKADLRRAYLSGANLSYANLSGANLSKAYLSCANLSYANLSGADGLLDPWQWLCDNFEQTQDGFIVFKRIGKTEYSQPTNWTIKPGAILREVVNPCRTTDCACGVNFGTLPWCKSHYTDADLWRCLLTWEGVASLVVPYNTDGKARTGCLQLLDVVSDDK